VKGKAKKFALLSIEQSKVSFDCIQKEKGKHKAMSSSEPNEAEGANLVWVITKCNVPTSSASSAGSDEESKTFWWPALKYPTLDDLCKNDPLVRDHLELKKEIFKIHCQVLTNKNLNCHPVARLLGGQGGPTGRYIEWLFPSNIQVGDLKAPEQLFYDHFIGLSKQFNHLPENNPTRILFVQALKEAMNQAVSDFVPSSQMCCFPSRLFSSEYLWNFGV